MADTVKKSRIVSDNNDNDDNLEEALMEEFNMRLKSCMSQDEIVEKSNIKIDDNSIQENQYENINIIKTNNSNNEQPIIIDSSGDFIKIERDNYLYDEPKKLSSTTIINNSSSSRSSNSNNSNSSDNNLNNTSNNIVDDNTLEVVEVYENLIINNKNNDKQQQDDDDNDNNQKTDDNLEIDNSTINDLILMDQSYVDMSLNKNYYQQEKPNTTTIDDDNDDNNTECVYEEIETKQIPTIINSTATTTTTNDDNNIEIKSIKDRMLLSTDDNSCLLFTQTITSPMLTPSEENIDFLKGFNQTTTNNKTVNDDNVDDSTKVVIKKEENIYENSEFLLKSCNNQHIIYENVDNIIKQKIDDDDDNNDDEVDRIITNTNTSHVVKNEEEIKNVVIETKNKAIIDDNNLKEEEVIINDDDNVNIITDNFLINERKLIESTIDDDNNIEDNNTTKLSSSSIIVEKINQINNKNDKNLIKSLENDTEMTVPIHIVQNLKNQFMNTNSNNTNANDNNCLIINNELKTINIMKQINKFEHKNNENDDNDDDDNMEDNNEIDDNNITESFVETTTTTTFETNSSPTLLLQDNSNKAIKKKKSKKSRKEEKENMSVNGSTTNNDELFYNVNVKNLCRSFGDLTKIGNDFNRTYNYNNCNTDRTKSSFNKFDALQKKNVLHVRSTDSSKAQDKFNDATLAEQQQQQQYDLTNCKSCNKAVFQMEQIKAEKCIWHRNCFRCVECSKQLTVDTYQSNEGLLYCKPHFKALFTPKAVEDDPSTPKSRKPELIIRENQPLELPPDVVRASDKPDLGLEELQSLNVKERFQVFENYKQQHEQQQQQLNDSNDIINVKRSPSILSKLAKFQSKGMDIGVTDDSLNGIPIEESSSENEDNNDENNFGGDGGDDGDEDVDLIRAKRVQKEKPFHFTGMLDVKNKWELGEQNLKDERREERKQEIQTIRNRLFLGKQVKMKEAYQQAVMESESSTNLRKNEDPSIELCDTKLIKERFEKGELNNDQINKIRDNEENEVYESEMSKKSRSIFKELDANASKPPQIVSMSTQPNIKLDIKQAREAYLSKTSNEDVIKSSTDQIGDIQVRTADIQERFKFFETYKEPENVKKNFRITPPREGQIKAPTPDREIYRDPDIVRSEEYIEDSVVAKQTHTATKMLNKFRQMEENLNKESMPQGPKPLKCFTPPPEPLRQVESSEEDGEESDEDDDEDDEQQHNVLDADLIEAQKAARAKKLCAKFERWEANEIKKEQQQNLINLSDEIGGGGEGGNEEQSQIESTRSLRARFESMRETNSDTNKSPRVKVNRFVEISNMTIEICDICNLRVYPLEKISVHGNIYHKSCFKCKECNCILRMESYSYNQGLLYCTTHFKRLFISKGNYDTAFGLGQHKEKWNCNNSNSNNNNNNKAAAAATLAAL